MIEERRDSKARIFWQRAATSSAVRSSVGRAARARVRDANEDESCARRYSCNELRSSSGSHLGCLVVAGGRGESKYSVIRADVVRDFVSVA